MEKYLYIKINKLLVKIIIKIIIINNIIYNKNNKKILVNDKLV